MKIAYINEEISKEKGTPLERVGRKASSLSPIKTDMAAGLPSIEYARQTHSAGRENGFFYGGAMRKSKVIFIAVMTIFLLGFATNSAILMAAVIVDNSDTGFSWEGTWGTAVGDPDWGTDYRWHETGIGTNTATWSADLTAGNYNVYAWWYAYENRATNSPYTINHDMGSETVRVCQKTCNGRWVYLGNYSFDGASSVSLSDDADDVDEFVIADAIKFDSGAPDNPYPIIDTNYIRFAGPSGWGGSATVGYNNDQVWHATGTGSNTATWTTNIPTADNYNVYAWWTAHDNRGTNVPYTINYQGGSKTVRVCQEIAGDQWVYLGNYPFAVGAYSVVLSDDADEYVIADAVRFAPGAPDNPYPIVDTNYIRFEGSGWEGSTTVGYNDDQAWHLAGVGDNTATWTTNIPAPGNYNVYAWWTAGTNRATNATYNINYGTGQSEDVMVCQEIAGSQWVFLGNYSFNAGAYSVVLSDNADEIVMADAIKFEPGSPPANPHPIIDTEHIRFEGNGWHGSTTTGYDDDIAYHAAGTGTNKATWTTDIPAADNYNVYAWWIEYSDRATNTPYTINYEGGSATVRVCQEISGSQWVYLGNYPFNVGTYSVVLSDDADENVYADAIKFELGSPDNPYPVADTDYIRFEGSGWHGATTGGYNDDFAHHVAGSGLNKTTWTTDITLAGNHDVWAWWTEYTDRATNAPYTVYYEGGSETVYKNQKTDGGQWVLLGNYNFNVGTYKVELTDNADGRVIADVIWWDNTEDNDEGGTGDGMRDGWELYYGLDPTVDDSTEDEDSDGLNNLGEFQNGTDPTEPDADGDGLLDGGEISNGTDPFDPDTDDDGLSDGWEVAHGFNPLVDDSDQAKIWDNDSTDGLWSTANNWSGDSLPEAGDVVVFNTTSTDDCTGDDITNNLQHVLLDFGYTGTLTMKQDSIDGGDTWTVTGDITLNEGNILCEGDPTVGDGEGITINAADIALASGTAIHADGQGFGAGAGPGTGVNGGSCSGGGGYGGRGGEGRDSLGGPTYGSVEQPTALGSGGGGGGTAGAGGGAIKLNVTNTLTVNGTISAKGTNGTSTYAGGSGGSIWLICDTFEGAGTITANGGDAGSTLDGGGGGGRISLQWTSGNRTFSGTIGAAGGVGYRTQYGRPGTIYVPAGLWNELFNATYPVNGSVALSAGTYNIATLHVTNNAVLSCQGDNDGDPVDGSGVVIVSTDITIDSGAKISADGEGFGPNAGPGKAANGTDCSGGAGYGGRGGDGRDSLGGPTYGSVDQPTALGSGGGGTNSGRGGGAIKLNVTNTLTVNGTISAKGTQGIGNYASGSGGSIWLVCSTFAGAGAINADGADGSSTLPGGGGGGRISLQWTSGNRTFSGTIGAAGGLGFRTQYGRPGTIYVPAGLWNELFNATYPVNGSVALVPGTYNITTLHVTNNANLSCQGDNDGDPVDGSGVVINSANVTIDSGAKISAGGEGFGPNAGPGKAANGGDCSGGGAYGGRGSDGRDSLGGLTYGSVDQPTALGSGGGGTNSGRGGGAIKLNVTNTLTVNGTISAKGTQGIGNYAGGSGGSIWLISSTFSGAGSINADGRDSGSTLPGGGGGGRISLQWTSGNRTFSGTIGAAGGLGYLSQYGRPGTIYVPAGLWNELFNATYPVNGSVALVPGTYNITTLHVTNNAILSCQGDDDGDPVDGSGVVINSANITIDSGAKISANGEGFIHDAGPGKPVNAGDCSGGAGYGGRGGDGRDSVGGPTYGTLYEPTSLGSGGGGSLAGRGGGAIKLVVTGTLTVDGTISANGAHGLGNFAGGSGGSIWLICDTLAGSGFIAADGGNGGNTTFPGGGGGGRIHISRTTWTYGGVVTAFGGTGRNSGEYGTTYYDNAFLDWTGEVNYTSDGLNPEWGKATVTTFTYRIKYTHMYNQAPSAVYVHVLKDGSEITGSPFTMSGVDPGDTTYDDGKLYYCDHVFAAKGDYTYYFGAETPSCGPGMGDGASENTGPAVVGLYVAQNQRTTTWYETIQLALDDAIAGDTIQVDLGLTHHEQIVIPSGVTLTGDTADPTGTTITMDSAPVVSFASVSSGSALTGLAIRYTGENLTREATARHYYVTIGDGASNITIDKCLIGRDGYASGWSSQDGRFLATTTYNDSGIYVGADASNVTITNCKIRYLTGPGIAVGDGGNDNITISNNHIYRNILPYDLRVDPYFEAPGIGLNGTARANINFNEIYENNVGIGAQDLNGTDGTEGTVHIEGNIIHHNNRAGIGLNTQIGGTYFKSTDIVGNEIYSNGSAKEMGAVRIRYAYDVKLRQNHIHDNVYMGTYLDHVYDFEIYNNNIYRNYWNVRLAYVGKNENDQSFFYKNIVDPMGNVRGLYMTRGSDITLSSNIFRNADCFGAFFDTQSGPIDFRHNKACNNGRPGLRVRGALSGNMFKNLVVSNGEIYASKGAGVRFEVNASGDLEIYNNTFADNRRAGLSFGGGLTTSTYSLFYNIFAFNTLAGYKYGGTAWNPIDRWDWVDKHENFFFWNYGSYCDSPDRRDRRKMVYSQWGGPGGSGTDDITMYDAHINCDEYAWDFTNDPDDPYSLDPLDVTGLLNLANGEAGGAYSSYSGRSASYIEPVPATTPASDPYVEPPAEAPPEVAAVPEPFLG